jgi:hypothetical protein
MNWAAIVTMIFISTKVFAGNESGGAMGVVCREPSGAVKSVELLDLWEARKVYGRRLVSSNASVEKQVEDGLQNLKHAINPDGYALGNDCGSHSTGPDCVTGAEAIYLQLKWDADRFLYNGNPPLPQFRRLRGVNLKLTDDSFELVTPKDCEIEQLVRYIDTTYGGEVLINQDLLDEMDNTNLAALYLHEVFYAMLRSEEKSSIRVRRAIGLMASGYRFKPWESLLPREYYDCNGRGARVFIYLTELHGNLLATTTHLVRAGYREMIGVEDADGGTLTNNLEDAFIHTEEWKPLNRIIGFDYSVRLSLYRENAIPKARVSLTSAPDQSGPAEEFVVDCKKISR